MAEIKRSLAVVIGINQYVNGIPMLKTAVKDATKIAHILETKYQYQVLLILDFAATGVELNNLFTALDKQIFPLPNGSNIQVDENDRILFYFAGHGIALDALDNSDGPHGYLVPQDAHMDNHSSLLPMTRLHNALLKLPCRHLLVILDCCFAGAFRWAGNREAVRRSNMYRERYERFISGYAHQVITSAADDEKSADSLYRFGQRSEHEGHSPFAELLLKALEGEADLSKDGVMTATELYVYLHSELGKTNLKQTPGFSQLKRHDKGEYIFVFGDFDPDNLKPAPPLDESNNPYRGLESFESEHSKLFYGRTNLIAKLPEFVSNQPLTVVLGASGTGKSSLVKAGLIPQLKDQQWRILAPFRPGESPFAALNNTLNKENLPVFQMPIIAFEHELQTLAQSVRAWSDEHPNTKLLLVIDQFEELVTMSRDDLEREKFLGGLARAIAAFPKQLRIVVTLRSDFEPQFQDTALEPYWQQARFIVPAMTREELRSVIVEPATTRVMYFEPPILVDQLIDEVVQMPGAMPLLSFTLSELYLKYIRSTFDGTRNNRAITQQDYEELGGVTRSLTQRADDEYTQLVKLDPAYAQTIKHVMLRMVAVGESELARRQVLCTELEYPEPENTRVKLAIEHFVAARLLVKGRNTENQEYIEPAHDFLVRGWQRLRTWKDKELGSLLLQRELTLIAHKWCMEKQNKKATGFLWDQDPRLPFVRQVFESKNNWLNTVESEFVNSSIQQKEKNRLRTFTLVAGTFALVLGFAFIQWTQNQDAQLRTLAASSEALFASNKQIDALIEGLKALKKMKSTVGIQADTKIKVMSTLHQIIYQIKERDRLLGHEASIQKVSFSPDGSILASASSGDSNIKLWRVVDGKEISALKAHKGGVKSVSFSSDGKMFASTGFRDHTIKIWNLEDSKLIITLEGHKDRVSSVSFSPDNKTLVASDLKKNNNIKLWRVEDGKELQTFKSHEAGVYGVTFSPNPPTPLIKGGEGGLIASASKDRTVRLWSLNGKLLKTLFGHKDEVMGVSFSPDGKMLASASFDTTIKLWTIPDGKQIATLTGHQEKVFSVNFSPNPPTPLAKGGEGGLIASAGADNTIKIWRMEDRKQIATLAGHTASVNSTSFSPDGLTLASGSNDSSIKLWSLESKEMKTLIGHTAAVYGIGYSPDGKTLASGSGDNTIKVWNLEKRQQIKTLKGHENTINYVSYSPEGKMLASASLDQTIKIWNVANGKEIKTLRGHQDKVYGVTFSPDGKQIASVSSDHTIRLWSVAEGKEIKTIKKKASFNSITFSPNGKKLVAASDDDTIKVFNLENDQEIMTLKGHQDAVHSISITPNGKQVVSGSRDNTIKLWSLESGKEITTFNGHTDRVIDVNISPNGKMLASASSDNSIKLWTMEGKEITTFKWLGASSYSVKFSPDNKTLASSSQDQTIRLWNLELLDLNNLLNSGCAWVNNYLHNNPKLNQEERRLCDDIRKN
ncbi:eIF2A-related protein [Iningainema tapete]|uniref:Caspase family protein n=1 Tax=Iningainema tapete BLCC-T55 TaxID=2748662 RepID=A0A8J7BY88_9CYAN|nr:caspase family protein [Iningainema tapete]MBD2775277.1 caspase family protein [Iningainema tapete BLCC-T55]